MIQFDTSQFKQFSREIESYKRELERGVKQFINHLIQNAKIQNKLEKKILETVYDRPEPEHYQRTMNLLESVRLKVEGNNIYLYMDDNWLAKQTSNDYSMETGSAPETHGSEGYAWAVEYDHTYNNEIGHPYTRTGSHYMELTFREIVSAIQSGEIDSKVLFEPLMRRWKN